MDPAQQRCFDAPAASGVSSNGDSKGCSEHVLESSVQAIRAVGAACRDPLTISGRGLPYFSRPCEKMT